MVFNAPVTWASVTMIGKVYIVFRIFFAILFYERWVNFKKI